MAMTLNPTTPNKCKSWKHHQGGRASGGINDGFTIAKGGLHLIGNGMSTKG
jgi:hypothetical protein